MATTTTTKRKSTTKPKAKKKPAATKKPAVAAKAKSKTTTTKVTKAVAKPAVATEKKTKVQATDKKGKVKKVRTTIEKLFIWNWVMAALHAAQGVAVVLLSRDVLFPVTTNYITLDSIASNEGAPVLVSATRNLFDVNLAYIVAAFFFMSSLAHLYIATIYRKKYEANLAKGINRVRWYEYGISASTMMLAIAMLSGVADISTLVMIFGATLIMNLCGLIMEVHNQTTQKTSWLSYVIGTIAGLGPWAVIGIYFWGANQYGEGQIPTFVYWIYVSIFLFFMSFAVNMYLQYKKVGRWQEYLYGEKAYMVLSLVAKSALAWQVFAGTLRP
jgi:hypothetical protein